MCRYTAILAVAAITLVTTGCALTPTRSCSGRITTDNGHVIRNEEDCVWGNKYLYAQPQPVYVVAQPNYAPQYVVVPQPVVIPPPVFMPPFPVFGAQFIHRGGVMPHYGGWRRR